MTTFDPVTHPDDTDDTEPPVPPELTVEWAEPTPIAQLFAVDGDVLLEVMDRHPAGYR